MYVSILTRLLLLNFSHDVLVVGGQCGNVYTAFRATIITDYPCFFFTFAFTSTLRLASCLMIKVDGFFLRSLSVNGALLTLLVSEPLLLLLNLSELLQMFFDFTLDFVISSFLHLLELGLLLHFIHFFNRPSSCFWIFLRD